MAGKSGGNKIADSYENDDGIYHLPPAVTESKTKSGGYEGPELFDEDYGKPSKEKMENNSELRQRKNERKNIEAKPSVLEKVKATLLDTEKIPSSNVHGTAFYSITEMTIKISFLSLVMALAWAMWPTSNEFLLKLVKEQFITGADVKNDTLINLNEIQERDDIWTYIENRLLPGIYWNETVEENSIKGEVMGANKYLGKLRLRMLKTRNVTCNVPEVFRDDRRKCVPYYSKSAEDKQPFGNSSAFIYTEASDLHTTDFTTPLGLTTYSGGGYVQDLPIDNLEEAYSIIQTLKDYDWINSDTRVVFMDFLSYNEAFHILMSVRLYVEMKPFTSAVKSNYKIKSFVLFPYLPSNGYGTSDGYWILLGEAMFCVFLLFFSIQVCKGLFTKRMNYFCSAWNVFDFAIIPLSIAFIVVTINFQIVIHNKVDTFFAKAYDYVDINEFYDAFILRNNAVLLLSIACWLRVFKYCGPTLYMARIVQTLYLSYREIIILTVIFAFVVLQFSLTALIFYNGNCADFSSFPSSIIAMVTLLMGETDMFCMIGTLPYTTHILIFVYIVMILFLVFNMYLAATGDSYLFVLDHGIGDRFILLEYFIYCINQVLYKLKIKRDPKEHEAEYKKWIEKMHKRGHHIKHINETLKRCWINTFEDFDEDKRDMAERDLAKYKIVTNVFCIDNAKEYVPHSDRLEKEIDEITAKIQRFMYDLDQMDDENVFK